MVSSSMCKVTCGKCHSNGVKIRRVDDNTPTDSKGSYFVDQLLDCEHYNVKSDTYCCNVINPFSSLNDCIRWRGTVQCKGCGKTLHFEAERQSTSNGEEGDKLKCGCANKGLVWVCVFQKWGHTELASKCGEISLALLALV